MKPLDHGRIQPGFTGRAQIQSRMVNLVQVVFVKKGQQVQTERGRPAGSERMIGRDHRIELLTDDGDAARREVLDQLAGTGIGFGQVRLFAGQENVGQLGAVQRLGRRGKLGQDFFGDGKFALADLDRSFEDPVQLPERTAPAARKWRQVKLAQKAGLQVQLMHEKLVKPLRVKHAQFLMLWIGAGIRPPRAMNAAEENPLTAMIGAEPSKPP